jgi:hypothetical protein
MLDEHYAAHPPATTPIATFGSEYELEPVAYGLKFAGELSGVSFLQGDFTSQLQATGVDATAYAGTLPSRHVAVIILNKDAEQNVKVNLDLDRGEPGRWRLRRCTLRRWIAAKLTSRGSRKLDVSRTASTP